MPNHISRSLFFLFLFVLLGFIFAQLFSLLLAQLFHIDLKELQGIAENGFESTHQNYLRTSLLVSHICTFILPGLAFLYVRYKNEALEFIQLKPKLKLNLFFLSVLFLIVCYPAVNFSYTINSWLPLADWMHQQEDKTAEMLKLILSMGSPAELIFNLILIAMIPAIGEELIFRGIVQRNLELGVKNEHWAVIISALVFSFFHFQFEGFLPRFCLGLVLGYVFIWTKNLLIPMILHFLNNAVPIVSYYFLEDDLAALDPSESESIPAYIAVISLVLGFAVAKTIINQTKNKTDIDRA